jgi:Tfp pilus assembly protein PilO
LDLSRLGRLELRRRYHHTFVLVVKLQQLHQNAVQVITMTFRCVMRQLMHQKRCESVIPECLNIPSRDWLEFNRAEDCETNQAFSKQTVVELLVETSNSKNQQSFPLLNHFLINQ